MTRGSEQGRNRSGKDASTRKGFAAIAVLYRSPHLARKACYQCRPDPTFKTPPEDQGKRKINCHRSGQRVSERSTRSEVDQVRGIRNQHPDDERNDRKDWQIARQWPRQHRVGDREGHGSAVAAMRGPWRDGIRTAHGVSSANWREFSYYTGLPHDSETKDAKPLPGRRPGASRPARSRVIKLDRRYHGTALLMEARSRDIGSSARRTWQLESAEE